MGTSTDTPSFDGPAFSHAPRPGTMLFETFADSLSSLVSYVDADLRYRYCNKTYERWFGLTRAEVVGRKVSDILGEAAFEQVGPKMLRTLTGETTVWEAVLPYKGAGTRAVKVIYHPDRAPDGAIPGFYVIVEDISARRELERRTAAALDESARSLQRERERLGVALRAASLGVYEWTVKTDSVWWSPETYDVYGVSRDTFSPSVDNFFALIHPDDLAEFRKRTQESLERREPFVHEYRVVRPDGAVRWIANRSHVVADEKGDIERVTGVAVDVTKEREAERRLQLIVSSIDDHLVSYDAQWRYTFVNDAAARVLGKAREELLGRCIWDLFPDAVNNQYYRELHEAFREKRVIRSEHYYAPFDVWFENHMYPSDIGVTVFSSDITERKRIEIALRESEERFRNMADHAPVMVWITRPDGYCTYLSKSWYELTGTSEESGLGFGWLDSIHPDDRAAAENAFMAANHEKALYQAEYRVRRRDGAYRWALDAAVPRLGPSGEFLGYIGSVIDITDRKNAEVTLRQQAAELEQFAYVASHDLQEPLRTISNFGGLLADSNDGALSESSRRYLARIVEAVGRMRLLVDGLLTYSRTGRTETKMEPVDTAQLVDKVLIDLAGALKAKNAAVDVGRLLPVTGDAVMIAQVFLNLISNALKFSAENVRLSLDAEPAPGGWARLRVSDNGIGIEADYLEKIFEPFKRLHPGAVYPGSGIGLAIVKKIVERHGGRVWAESQPGQGSTFFFTLPSAPQK